MAKAKKENVTPEEKLEIKSLAAQVGEQLANKDYEGAWTTMGALNSKFKDNGDSLTPGSNMMLTEGIRKYYYQNKKLSSASYGLQKLSEVFQEAAALIKVED